MGNDLNPTAKKIRICAKLTRCWKADISERRNAVRRENWRRRNWLEAAKAKAEFLKLIRPPKRKIWSKY
jgi:hypothetical protein